MNIVAPEKREAAVELLKSGASVREVSQKVGIHRNSVLSIRKQEGFTNAPKMFGPNGIANPTWLVRGNGRPQKVSTGKGDDALAGIPMTKSRRQYLRDKQAGKFKKNKCKDCGSRCSNQKCWGCWRRTAALKRLAKQFHEDSPEYEAGLMEIYATDYTKP